MPNWLWRSIIGVSTAVSILAVGQWASCRFYVLPQLIAISGNNPSEGSLQSSRAGEAGPGELGCGDVDSRAVGVLMGVLTTLISLSTKTDR